MNKEIKISSWSKRRLEEQGFCGLSDADLALHRFGIRFAYFVCAGLVIAGLIFNSQPILLIANGIAIFGTLPPYHPIDYLYNYGIRYIIGRPKLPHRANQSRFACGIATVMLAVINYYFYLGNFKAVYIVSAALLTSAFLVSLFDLCIPSKIYNAIFKKQVDTTGR